MQKIKTEMKYLSSSVSVKNRNIKDLKTKVDKKDIVFDIFEFQVTDSTFIVNLSGSKYICSLISRIYIILCA